MRRLPTLLVTTAVLAASVAGFTLTATAQDTAAPEAEAEAQAPSLLDALGGDTAEPVAAGTPEEERMRALIIDTLVANPDILVEALTRINTQQEEARAALEAREARIRDIAANAIGAPVVGNPDGDVTIVAFTDYNCPHCRAAHEVLEKVVAEDGNIRVVHRELPILGADSLLASKAALAADAQGKYADFHDALMGLTDPVTTQNLLKAALDSGVDINAMLVAQEDAKVVGHIDDSKAIATEFGIEGTPAYFIGTTVASGAPTEADLKAAIASERARQNGSDTDTP